MKIGVDQVEGATNLSLERTKKANDASDKIMQEMLRFESMTELIKHVAILSMENQYRKAVMEDQKELIIKLQTND